MLSAQKGTNPGRKASPNSKQKALERFKEELKNPEGWDTTGSYGIVRDQWLATVSGGTVAVRLGMERVFFGTDEELAAQIKAILGSGRTLSDINSAENILNLLANLP